MASNHDMNVFESKKGGKENDNHGNSSESQVSLIFVFAFHWFILITFLLMKGSNREIPDKKKIQLNLPIIWTQSLGLRMRYMIFQAWRSDHAYAYIYLSFVMRVLSSKIPVV